MELRILTLDELEEAAAFSWNLCSQDCTRSYQLFRNITEVKKEYKWSIIHKDSDVVGCYIENDLAGILCYQVQEYQYIQTTGFYVNENSIEVANNLASFIDRHYPDYTINIGITKENTTVTEALIKRKYKLVEDSIDMRLCIDNFLIGEEAMSGIRKIHKSEMKNYLRFHEKYFQNCYWNAERLEADFQNWHVYADVINGEIINGGVFIRCYNNQTAEVFGMYAPDESSSKRLLNYSIMDLVHTYQDLKTVVYMIEAADLQYTQAAHAAGFIQKNHYCCYQKQT